MDFNYKNKILEEELSNWELRLFLLKSRRNSGNCRNFYWTSKNTKNTKSLPFMMRLRLWCRFCVLLLVWQGSTPSVANGDLLPFVGPQPHSVATLKTPVVQIKAPRHTINLCEISAWTEVFSRFLLKKFLQFPLFLRDFNKKNLNSQFDNFFYKILFL